MKRSPSEEGGYSSVLFLTMRSDNTLGHLLLEVATRVLA